MAKGKKTVIPDAENHFEYEGKKYQVLGTFQSTNIPGIGIRTAQEILSDPAAQAHLVKEKCFTLIGEVIA